MTMNARTMWPVLTTRLNPTALMVVLGLAAGAGVAVAAPIISTPQVYSFSLNISDNTGSPLLTASATPSFSRFDSTLGTLQQVVFRWTSTLTANSTFTPANFTLEPSTLEIEAGISLNGLGSLFNRSFSDAYDPAVASISENVSGDRAYSSPTDLAYFIGSGTFAADIALTARVVTVNESDTLDADWGTQRTPGQLSLEYIYEARPTGQVPEPGVLILGGIAAVALGASRLRDRRAHG